MVAHQERLDSPAPVRQPSVTAEQYTARAPEHQLRSRAEQFYEVTLYTIQLQRTALESQSLGQAVGLPPEVAK